MDDARWGKIVAKRGRFFALKKKTFRQGTGNSRKHQETTTLAKTFSQLPVLLLCTVLVITTTSQDANATTWGPEREISMDIGTEAQVEPSIAVEGSNVHVVWYDSRDGDFDIYYRHYNGTAWQPEQEISTDVGTEHQMTPSIAVDGDNVHVVWVDRRNGNDDIYYRHYNGTTWQPQQEISTDVGTEDQWSPSIAVEGDNVHVVWEDQGGLDRDIYYRYFDGTNWQPEEEISTDIGTETQYLPLVEVVGSKVHVIWYDEGDGDGDIYYRHFNGTSWLPEQEISIDVGIEGQWHFSMAADGDDVHVAWYDGGGWDYDIYYRHFNGSVWGSRQEISTDVGTEDQLYPSIAADAGKVHVAWEDRKNGDYNPDICYRYFDGTVWHPEERIRKGPGMGWQYDPSIAADGYRVHVVWADKRDGDYDIYYRAGGNEDRTPPESNAVLISPFWWTTTAIEVEWTATDDADLANISMFYRYSFDNSSWIAWEEWAHDNTISGPSASGSFLFTATYGDGFYEFHTIANDTFGNGETAPTSADVIVGVDTTHPTGSLIINEGDAWTTSMSVSLTLVYSDTLSGVSQVRYSNDGIWDTEPWEAPSTTKAWNLEVGDGTKAVYYRIKDNAGLISTYSDEITLDATEPTGSITIDNGDLWTISTSVTLTLTYSDGLSGVSQVRYSNDGTWDDEVWESPSAPKSWTLLAGDGTKTVYYQVKDNAGLTSAVYSDDIGLDTTQPTGLVIINNGDASTESTSVALTLTYSDSTSGVYQVRYSDDGTWDTEPWESPSATKAWTLADGEGTKTVYYEIVDNAGIESITYEDHITLVVPSVIIPPDEFPVEPTVVVAATAITIAATSVLLLEWLKYAFLTLFLPLYTRLKREKVLDHETRGMIRGYIIANPGDHFNSIKSALALKNGTLAYHLRVLEREKFIKSVRDGKYRRFFPVGAKVSEEGYPTKVEGLILDILKETPGLTQKDIAKVLGVSQPAVSYHVNRLIELDKVRTEKRRMSLRYYVNDSP
jgi:predicted transcriptional regulator